MLPAPPPSTLTVQRLEAAEAALARALDGGSGRAAMGGYTAFVSPESPWTHVVGAGVTGPVLAAELDAVESFYAEREAEAVFELSPMVEESLLTLLKSRGYRLRQFENALVIQLTPAPPVPPVPAATALSATVRSIGVEEQVAWAQLAARGFFSRDDVSAEEVAIGESLARVTRAYVAEVDGQAVATASLWLRDEIAFFLGDATLPAYRGRGCQQALIQQRLIDAVAAGARYATAGTAVNSVSQTNYLRCGFRVLYTKFSLARPGAAGTV